MCKCCITLITINDDLWKTIQISIPKRALRKAKGKEPKHTNVGARVQVCVYVYWRLCQHVPYHTSIVYSYDMVVLAPAKFPSSKKLLTAIDLTPFMNS